MKRILSNGWLVLLLVAICGVAAVFALDRGFDAGIKGEASSESRRLNEKPVPEGLLDVRAGTYRGVALNDSAASVRRSMGGPEAADDDAFSPTVVGHRDPWIGPSSATCGKKRAPMARMAYRDVLFILRDGTVCAIVVGGGGWTTTEGVASGDPITEFEDRNPDARCFEQSLNEWNLREQRDCKLRLDNGLLLWIGGDPVNGAALTSGTVSQW
jgi:hypothetical protein